MPEKRSSLEGSYYGSATVVKDFPYNKYSVGVLSISEREKKLADLMAGVMLRRASFRELSSELGAKGQEFTSAFKSDIVDTVELNELVSKLPRQELLIQLREGLLKLCKGLKLSNVNAFVEYVLSSSIGLKKLDALLSDNDLEEIMVNGVKRHIFVFHKKYGMCKTDLAIDNEEEMQGLVHRIASSVGRSFNEQHPLLDAMLPDGSRANATLSYVSPAGTSLTIRKFTPVPLSIVDLIEKGTLNPDVGAFLWAMVEGLNINPMNIIVAGGAGSGKTTLLNVLCNFIPIRDRIISIEDTLELDLGKRENWIALEAKPAMKGISEVAMDDLLKNAMRMRPDRIIIGEVRGKEAQTMFTAMDTGHEGMMGTLHSNSAREMLLRLGTAPMNVPESMVPLLDLVIVTQRFYDRKCGILRRIKQIAEVSRMGQKVLLSNIYEFDAKKDSIEKTNVPSHIIEALAESAKMSKNELSREMLVRRKILEWMKCSRIRKNPDVSEIIQTYYSSPETLLEEITKDF